MPTASILDADDALARERRKKCHERVRFSDPARAGNR
jgi:hypothetical protein